MPNTRGGIHWRDIHDIRLDIRDYDIQACHRLKNKDRTIVKFTNRKVVFKFCKRQLKCIDPTAVDFVRRNQNIYQLEFVPLLKKDLEQMQKVKVQTKSSLILQSKWFNSFTN